MTIKKKSKYISPQQFHISDIVFRRQEIAIRNIPVENIKMKPSGIAVCNRDVSGYPLYSALLTKG